uniref:HMG box domain-containing protein n=1 Tax=Rhabditophanes sp. KR3021 TaxID=114890 RepID=A0AC35TSR4_9BILA
MSPRTPMLDPNESSNMSFDDQTTHFDELTTTIEICGPNEEFVKRPMNAYMFFSRAQRKIIAKQNPTFKMNEISREYFKDNPTMKYLPPRKKANPSKTPKDSNSETASVNSTEKPARKKQRVSKTIKDTNRQTTSVHTTRETAIRKPSSASTPVNTSRYAGQPLISKANANVYMLQPLTTSNLSLAPTQYSTAEQMSIRSGNSTIVSRVPVQASATCTTPITQRPIRESVQPLSLTEDEALDLYYQSLSAPQFPHYLEDQSNPLQMNTPNFYYDQWRNIVNSKYHHM